MAAPKPINHSISSGLATTGYETAKGGLIGGTIGVVASFAIGALIIGAAVLVGGAAIGAVAGGVGSLFTAATVAQGMASGAAMMFSTGGLVATGVMATMGGLASGLGLGAWGAAIGGALGIVRGRRRVGREVEAYQGRVRQEQMGVANTMNAVAMSGMQEGYTMGVEAGRNQMADEIRQQISKQQQPAPAAAEPEVQGKFTAKCETKCESKVEALAKQREAQAETPRQI